MKIKHCVDCGEDNIITAKYCVACRFKFPILNATESSQTTPDTNRPKPKVVKLEYDTNVNENSLEIPDDLKDESPSLASTLRNSKGVPKQKSHNLNEEDEMLANSLVDFVASMCGEAASGVKLGEVFGSNPALKKEKRAKDSSLPKTAKEILAQTKNRKNE